MIHHSKWSFFWGWKAGPPPENSAIHYINTLKKNKSHYYFTQKKARDRFQHS